VLPRALVSAPLISKQKRPDRRGSRNWFVQKIDTIEKIGNALARQFAADEWARIVWQNPIESGFVGADALDQIHDLSTFASKIKDPATAARVTEIMLSSDDKKKKKIQVIAQDEQIKAALRDQTLTEEAICRLASAYSTPMFPKGHLRIRRQLRRQAKRGVATLNMHLGMIGRNGQKYATAHEISLRNQQKDRWQKFGEATILTRGDATISMADVMKSGHKNKVAELITLTTGLAKYAKSQGLGWCFVTLTAPPNMHSNPKNGNNSWDGTTPKEANEWIQLAAARAEARMRKEGIIISGFRVVEPHDDGCPHWHILVFTHKANFPGIEDAYRYQDEWMDDAGMKFVVGDDSRSAASSYMTKYILKSISAIEKIGGEAGAIDAWYSTWGIRKFAFLGLPQKKLWRNLRAVKDCPSDPLVAGMWRAAHRGDACTFISLSGGLNIKNSKRPVKTINGDAGDVKSIEFISRVTGESEVTVFEKWVQSPANTGTECPKMKKVGLIQNYPRKSKPETRDFDHLPDSPPFRPNCSENEPFWMAGWQDRPKSKPAIPLPARDLPYRYHETIEKDWRFKANGEGAPSFSLQ